MKTKSQSSKSSAELRRQGTGRQDQVNSVVIPFKLRLVNRRLAKALEGLDEGDPEYFRRVLHRVTLEMNALIESLYGKRSVPASPTAVAEYYGMTEDIEAAKSSTLPAAHERVGANSVLESPHPDEYVVIRGSGAVFHSPDQLEALGWYAELLQAEGEPPPVFIPPRTEHEASRGEMQEVDPQVRGRAAVDELWRHQ